MDFNKFFKILYYYSPNYSLKKIKNYVFRKNIVELNINESEMVFVLSTGRAGTETLSKLLAHNKKFFVYHEPFPLTYSLSKIAYQYEGKYDIKVLSEAFRAMKKDLFDTSKENGKGYIETGPQNTFLAQVILESIPSAKFIYLVRDPRDVIRSGMRRKWYIGHQNDPFRITPLEHSYHAGLWDTYSPLQKVAWLWDETNRWIMNFTSRLPSEKVLLVHSEDIFLMNLKTISSLYEFIGMKPLNNSKIENILKKKINAQKTGDFAPYDLWTNEQKRQFQNIVSETAKELGYDLS